MSGKPQCTTMTPAMCERLLDALQDYDTARLAWVVSPMDEARIEAHARSITALADIAAELGMALRKAKAMGLYTSPADKH